MPHRILITGASIAGNAAAFWLARHGHDVTVVERADGLATAGRPSTCGAGEARR